VAKSRQDSVCLMVVVSVSSMQWFVFSKNTDNKFLEQRINIIFLVKWEKNATDIY